MGHQIDMQCTSEKSKRNYRNQGDSTMQTSQICALALAISLTSGCATTELSPEGSRVRTISPSVAQNCKLKSSGTVFKPVAAGGLAAAQIETRNSVAKFGGNAMVIVSQYVDPPPYQHGHVTSEGYYCDDLARMDRPTSIERDEKFGLVCDDLNDQLRKELERNTGVLVVRVIEDSPTWNANVIAGDVLIELNNTPVKNKAQLFELLSQIDPKGDRLNLKLIRKGSVRAIEVK